MRRFNRIAYPILALAVLFAAGAFAKVELASLGMEHYDLRNYSKARKLLLVPGHLGDSTAQTLLGSMYATGSGTKRDANEALYWLEKAANNGVPQAQMMLGTLYMSGAGVRSDPGKAAHWLEKAARAGDKDAQELLDQLGAANARRM